MPNSIPQGYNVFFDIIQKVQDEGVDLPFQDTLNFIGAGVTATDDPGNNRTNIDIPGQVPHDLLDGNINQDTVAQAVSRGSLVYGNSTPLWDELAVGTSGQFLTTDGIDTFWGNLPADVDFYQTIQDEGIALPQQPTFNFIGTNVTATDDPANNRTNITFTGEGVDTFIYGFHDDGDLSGGGSEFEGWFSDDPTSTELHAQSFVAFAYTIKRGTVHIGVNTSAQTTDLVVRKNGVDIANTLITVPSSTTGSFDTGAISEAVSANDLTNLRTNRNGGPVVGDYNYHMECMR